MTNRKVTQAKLHEGPFIIGVGNLEATLPSQTKTLKDFRMELEPSGALLLSWTAFSGPHRVKKQYLIGAATVAGCLFEDETIPPNETA